jgi:ABC-type transport system substrate-binding protein
MFRDGAGGPLGVEIRTTRGQELQSKLTTSTADYWQRIGVATAMVFVPPEQADGREYRATMPGFDMKTQPADDGFLSRVYSNKTPLPENNFVGNNYSRYVNAEWDAIIDRYFATIPRRQRTAVVAEAVRHQTENLNLMGLFWDGSVTLISNRLANVAGSSATWNANLWNLAE